MMPTFWLIEKDLSKATGKEEEQI